ncbi:MAG: polyribonucleotide nucleotidyltransferase [Deltaproteobacteria bacterium]|uniref:Polyribonucleotide nucleotidyltransferase n=1 Tax=Candidatus Zymogenus saltonus TaxID=2844893 RepID=A0A9D8KG32_9DELT|nr:polyribonucleotide nucleotidyltransferase [Candidatus Zymogenus saltonus]
MTKATEKRVDFYGRPFSLETGKLAKQADGTVMVKYGDSRVLVTAVSLDSTKEGTDFLPLTVEYQEMTYAAGKIPGGFFKREGRPSEKEILTCRIIDRPVRPLFPDGYNFETQIIATVLSVDSDNDPDIMALTGASCALSISDIPFHGPIAAVRVGRVNGDFIINPGEDELEISEMDLVVAGSRDSVVMVEGKFKETDESVALEAIFKAHEAIQPLIDMQYELMEEVGKKKREFEERPFGKDYFSDAEEKNSKKISEALKIRIKRERNGALGQLKADYIDTLGVEEDASKIMEASSAFDNAEKKVMRSIVLNDGVRIDGRKFDEIRDIDIEVGFLPRTHGSALFTRGETQSLSTATLGTSQDEQRIDALRGESTKSFMLHYNFPPFSVGEARFLRGPSRREIGHGALAERAISGVLPEEEGFPYTIRIVSEILESNGSSSMATVCGASLSLMDAGVPIRKHVAGIAMGLIKEGDRVAVLSDIMGDEDHAGDMDFKVAGTDSGISALQMDIKIKGVDREILGKALDQAKEGRLFILKKMMDAIERPRPDLSKYAPRILTIHINPDKIRDIIGPGGKIIRGIIAETGAKIEVTDDGRVDIATHDEEAARKAVSIIENLTKEAEIGQIYEGRVVKIMDFGAFVEILPGVDGLVHISQLDHHRVNQVTDVLKEGDIVRVKVIDIDREGRIKLSRKDALKDEGPSPRDKRRPQ